MSTIDIKNEISEIENGFQLFDIDNKGLIDPKELKETMDEMNLKEKNPFVYDFISSLCSQKNIKQKGGITSDEFISKLQEKISDNESKEGIKRIFNVFSDSNTEKLPMPSFYQTAREIGDIESEQELKELIDKSNMNGKELNFNEFYDIMTEKENTKNKNYSYRAKNYINNNNNNFTKYKINNNNSNEKEDIDEPKARKHYTYSRKIEINTNVKENNKPEDDNSGKKARYHRRYRENKSNEGLEGNGAKVVSSTVVTTTTGVRYRKK